MNRIREVMRVLPSGFTNHTDSILHVSASAVLSLLDGEGQPPEKRQGGVLLKNNSNGESFFASV